ncbi:phage holin family protein [Mycolicibacterium sp. BiH015]|uniref:phage holin family protein n=1 Tax=Mycolicibacterium sp. BiH015 TaxID=3018808 RepID=UPI0022E56D35|nr:phage holin family protein [Mycolicibacterium sp. BiH015]MDA2890436.1 phage holin family protein [Mycolicibacterium sp. BiH015]
MLIVALVLAVVGLAALVMAVVTSNELIAWVCIAASVIGVVLLIVDAIRDRSKSDVDEKPSETDVFEEGEADYEDYPDEAPIAEEYDETSRDDTVAVDVASAEQPGEPSDDEKPKG